MSSNALRDLLNRLRWSGPAAGAGVVLTVRTREGTGEQRTRLPFAEVRAILPAGVEVADGTFLPYHRIVTVRREHETLWDSERRGGGEA